MSASLNPVRHVPTGCTQTITDKSQPRTAKKPASSQTGLERDPSLIYLASAAAPDAAAASARAVTALSTQDPTPAASVVSVAAHLHSRATESPATLATGSAEDPFRHPLHLPPAKAAALGVASKEVPARAADSPPPGARVKALKALVGPAVSSRSDRNLRGSLLRQTMTTSGDPRCAPMRLSSRQHPHPTLARHHHRHRRPLHPPAALA